MRLVLVLVVLQIVTGRGLEAEDLEAEDEEASSLCRRCHQHAQCETRRDGAKVCLCKQGFHGNGISLCADVDECHMNDTCGPNELCQNSPGSYECRCRPGFTRRKGRCVDSQAGSRINTSSKSLDFSPAAKSTASTRDALLTTVSLQTTVSLLTTKDTAKKSCPSPCHANAVCEEAKRSCKCNQGYYGNGITICKDTDECEEKETCGKKQICQNTAGSYRCICPNNTVKSGKTCVEIRQGVMCPTISKCGVSFPETHPHTVQNASCYPNSTGLATYYCNAGAVWYKNGPNFSKCTNQGLTRSTASEPTRRWMSELCGDLALTEDMMAQKTNSSANDILQSAVFFAASLLPRELPEDSAALDPSEAARLFSRSLDKIDKFASMAAAHLTSTEQDVRVWAEGNELRVISLTTGVSHHNFVPSGVDAGIFLTVNKTELKTDAAQVSFGYNPHVHSHLPPLLPVLGSPDFLALGPLRVISAVVSATLLSKDLDNVQLIGNVNISLRLLQDPHGLLLCGFWVPNANTWDTLGCEITSFNNSHAQCSCCHLTHFAILLAQRKVSDGDAFILSVLTRVALSVSLICLALSVATFTLSRALNGARNSVHTNLCVTLFIAEFIFLLGVQRTENIVLCKVVAYFLHYFFLAAFTWMSLEGVCLYFMVVQVFRSRDLPVRWLYAIGYGVPLVILILTAAIAPGSHGTDQICWLDKSIYWSFAGPVLFVITTNLGFLGVTMYKMIQHRHPITPGVSCMESMRVLVMSSLALTFLLGVPWIFGLFYVSDGTIFFLYIFTVFAALQGLFIFVFHCLLQKKVRDEYVRATRRLCGYTELVRGSHSSSSGRTRGSVGTGFGTSFKCEETNVGFRSEVFQPSYTENGVGGHLETFSKPRAD